MKFIQKYFIYYPIFWLGYWLFKRSGKTNYYSYISLRRLFYLSGGKFNDNFSQKLSKKNGKYSIDTPEGVIKDLTNNKLREIVRSLDEKGYHIFEEKLAPEVVDQLVQFAQNTPATPMPNYQQSPDLIYDKDNLIAPKYNFDENKVCNNDTVQKLLKDKSLINIAQNYLGSKPVLDRVAMWWSAPFNSDAQAQSAVAQMYHFDMDRIKFLKFFFYLTDVEAQTGPHCYVSHSHKVLPKELRRDGRFSNQEVKEIYPGQEVEITGSKGSIIVVDTRGLHKGKPLTEGERLLLQFEFSNSLFGAEYNEISLKKDSLNDELAGTMEQFPYTFQRFQS